MTITRDHINNNGPMYQIQFHNGTTYTSKDNEDTWYLEAAKAIARNVAKRRNTTVRLLKVEEPINTESPYDHVLTFVNDLKGQSLRKELKAHSLPYGSDAAYSKRERLLAHMLRCNGSH